MPRTKTQSSGRNEFALFKQPRSPYFSIRVMVRGERRKFSTGESTIAAARRKATAIMADIKSRGLDEAKQQRLASDEAAYKPFANWLSHWHQRISEWPGKKS